MHEELDAIRKELCVDDIPYVPAQVEQTRALVAHTPPPGGRHSRTSS